MVMYNRGKHLFADPTQATAEAPFLFASDVIKLALMDESYVLDIDAHDHFDDIVADEITATNYTSRGQEIGSKVSSQNDTDDRAEWDCADELFSSIGGAANDTFDQVVGLREPDSGASDANSELLSHHACAATLTNGGDITIAIDSTGLIHLRHVV